MGKTFNEPNSVFTSDFVPSSHTYMDLVVDVNNNIQIVFVTLSDSTEGEGSDHGDSGKILNVSVLNKTGNKLGELAFSSKQNEEISNPSLIPLLNGIMIGFSIGYNFNIITMRL